MKNFKRPLAAAGLAVFLSDVLMILVSPEAVIPAVLILTLIAAFFAARKKRIALALFFAVVFSAFSGIVFNFQLLQVEKTKALAGKKLAVTGKVYDYPIKKEGGFNKLILEKCCIGSNKVSGKITVYTKEYLEVFPGDAATFTATEIIPSENTDIYKYHKLSGREYLTAFCSGSISFTPKSKNTAKTLIFSLRKNVSDKIYGRMEKEPADVANALITGDKSYFSNKMKSNLRISGVSHIFAVSGMHLALWTGILFFIMTKRSITKILPNLFAMGFVVFYMFFTGLSPSVIRSGIMLISIFLGSALRKKADALNSLGLSALLMLSVNPFLAGNISFLLSFGATFALTAVAPAAYLRNKKNRKLSRLSKMKYNLESSVFFSFTVLFTLLPLSAVFFGYVSLLTPVSTALLTPIAEILMVSCSAGVLLPNKFFLSRYAFKLAELCGKAIIGYTHNMRKYEFALFPLERNIIIPWFFITAVLSAAAYFLFYKNKRMLLGSLLSCSFLLVCISATLSGIRYGDVELYFPQAGENSCFCLVSSSGAASLIYGAGGSYSSCSRITNFLNAHTAINADYLIIPRDKKTENANVEYFENSAFPEKILHLYDKNSSAGCRFKSSLWKNAEIMSETADDFSASVLYVNGKKLVVCFLPSSDFTNADKIYKSGDLLICRSKLPLTLNKNNFGKIILMSEYDPPSADKNVLSTANGEIIITLKGEEKCPISMRKPSKN